MEPTHVFAGLAVSDYKVSLRWWEGLLGRGPDMLPTAGEAVWRPRHMRFLGRVLERGTRAR